MNVKENARNMRKVKGINPIEENPPAKEIIKEKQTYIDIDIDIYIYIYIYVYICYLYTHI